MKNEGEHRDTKVVKTMEKKDEKKKRGSVKPSQGGSSSPSHYCLSFQFSYFFLLFSFCFCFFRRTFLINIARMVPL